MKTSTGENGTAVATTRRVAKARGAEPARGDFDGDADYVDANFERGADGTLRLKSQVEIRDIRTARAAVRVVGVSPLLVSGWSEAAIAKIEAKQGKQAKGTKPPRDPKQEFIDAFYPDPDTGKACDPEKGPYFFPAQAFKAAMLSATRFVDGISKPTLKGAVHVFETWARIHGSTPRMRRDIGRIGKAPQKIASPIYRPFFGRWCCDFELLWNVDAITLDQIATLINSSGFHVGVGAWRPLVEGSMGNGGPHGLYRILGIASDMKKLKADCDPKLRKRGFKPAEIER